MKKGVESLLKGRVEKDVYTVDEFRQHFAKKLAKKTSVKRPVFLKKVESGEFPITINIVPLSVNQAWKGRRVRSDKYVEYSKAFTYMLPNKVIIPEGYLEIRFWFGLSSILADFDNPCKPNLDLIAAKYGFNDKMIKRGIIEVEKVDKGNEYVRFEIVKFNQ